MIHYRPINEITCCKAHVDCRVRAAFRVQLLRGRRLEDRPYCPGHLECLRAKKGKKLVLGHMPTSRGSTRSVRLD